MNVAALIARLLLGLWFLVVGASPFFVAPPPQPGLAGEFIEIFYRSHWTLFVGAAQLALGAQLLVNRFVPLALIVLAAFLYNSFAFHLLIAPATLFAPVIVLALWFLVAWPYRGLFATIFTAKPSIQPRDMRDDAVPMKFGRSS